MPLPVAVVACEVGDSGRSVVEDVLRGAARVVHLPELAGASRAEALAAAAVLLARNTARDLRAAEIPLLRGLRLIQFVTAGLDYIPLRELPPGVPVAGNGGACAVPMSEHVVALVLAAAKRIVVEQASLARGEFQQRRPNRLLAGGVFGVLGLGGVGTAAARLMRGLGMRIHAINRRGATEEPVDWIGGPERLPELLAAADVLLLSLPLTRATVSLIGAAQLARMKEDAILVNVARGEIVDEDALYAHLLAHPGFFACIDAWWVEPVRHGRFALRHPFLDLPNVVGSPHNAAAVPGWHDISLRYAAENCRRALAGERPLHLVGEEERLR